MALLLENLQVRQETISFFVNVFAPDTELILLPTKNKLSNVLYSLMFTNYFIS